MQHFGVCKKRAFGIAMPLPGLLNDKYRQAVRIMKITAFILLVCFLHVSAKSPAQEKITIREKGAPLVKIFTQINKQTGYNFLFTNEDLRNAKPVDIEVKNASLKEVLDLLFKKQDLSYVITDKIITIVSKKNDEPVKAEPAVPLPIDIHGKVVDENGKPVPSVTVMVKGSKKQTITDEKGEFSISDVSDNGVLIFSSVNMEAFEVSVSGQKEILAKLKTKTSELDEVQIIAYGQTTKRFNTGNVTSVKASEIEMQPVNNPLLALEGRVPGLFITQSTGLPGSGVTVRIQGQNSLSKGNDPLYIIDGVPYASQLLPTTSPNGFNPIGESGGSVIDGVAPGNGNPLSYINPSDIESIEILKDADATAIYGSRAANGAILITTKRGKIGQTKIDFDLQSGIGNVGKKISLLNTPQYIEMRREALSNDNLIPSSDPNALMPEKFAPDLTIWDTTSYTNWQKALIGGSAKFTKFNANISGGTAAIQYLLGATYHRETTVFPGNFDDKKGAFHFHLNSISSNQKLQIQLFGNYLFDYNKLPQSDLTATAITLAPNAPSLYNQDNTLNWSPDMFGNSTWTNPIAVLNNKYKGKTSNLLSNASLEYAILPYLKFKSNFGYNDLQITEFKTSPLIAKRPENRIRSIRSSGFTNSRISSWIIEPQLQFNNILFSGKFDALIGASVHQNNSNGQYLSASGFNNDAVMEDIKSATSISVSSNVASAYKYNAVFGRIGYNLENKYLLNLTFRRDGSSRFGAANKFHNFGAIGAGWIFSEEKIFKSISQVFSFGKFRASYGTTGNDQIGDYQFLNLYSPTTVGVPYQNTNGLIVNGIPNQYLQWEETKKAQFGLDLGFLRDRILLNLNYVDNKSSNQLLIYSLPIITGVGGVLMNFPATVQNTQWEISLNTINIKSKELSWSTNLNLTIPRNKLKAFPNLQASTYADNLFVGESINVIKAYHFKGVDPVEGAYQVADKDGKPTLFPDYDLDRIVHLNPDPKFYGGFENSIKINRFQLDLLLQFVKQIGPNYFFGSPMDDVGGTGLNEPSTVLNRWQKPGDNASIQRYSANSNYYYQLFNAMSSDAAYSDASYIRLKNVSISWQLNDNWIKKVHLKSFRVYMQGQNIFTLTRYKGIDPENKNINSLPPLRVITIGAQVSF